MTPKHLLFSIPCVTSNDTPKLFIFLAKLFESLQETEMREYESTIIYVCHMCILQYKY